MADPETSLIAFQSSFKFVNCLPLLYTLLLIMVHKFSMGFNSELFGGHTITLSLLKPAFVSQSELRRPMCWGIILLENHGSLERLRLLLQPRREVLVKELTVGLRINFDPCFDFERSKNGIFFDSCPNHYPSAALLATNPNSGLRP